MMSKSGRIYSPLCSRMPHSSAGHKHMQSWVGKLGQIEVVPKLGQNRDQRHWLPGDDILHLVTSFYKKDDTLLVSSMNKTRSPAVARDGRLYCRINLILTPSPSLIDF